MIDLRTIREWGEATRDAELRRGPTILESIRRAEFICTRLNLQQVHEIAAELQSREDRADVLQALRLLLESVGDSPDDDRFRQLCGAYDLAVRIPWEDEVGEGADLRMNLALIAWRHCRRFKTYREAHEWEARCVMEALSQEHVCDFIALSGRARSDALSRRYFSDGAVLVALCRKLQDERNNDFSWVATEASLAFEAMERLELPAIAEERAFFMASAAFSAACSFKYLGSFRVAKKWLTLARKSLETVVGSRPYRALVDFAELALLQEFHDHRAIVERVDDVRQELVVCGLDWHVACADLLRGECFKADGRLSEALVAYREVAECPASAGDHLLRGLALLNAAGVSARLDAKVDLNAFRMAQEVLEKQPAKWPLAQLQASVGEFLRDSGRIGAAIEAYRSSVRLYEDLDMKSKAAYVRLLLAEALIAAGRVLDAGAEITQVLRVAEEHGVAADIFAAVTLLQQALERVSTSNENAHTRRLQLLRNLLRAEK